MSNRDKDAEILALRHQLSVLQRQLGPVSVRFTPGDRALLAALLHRLPRNVLKRLHLVVRPDTVLRWHRDVVACRRATTSRCQRSTVSGRTTKCSLLRTFLGSRCSSAASNARSPGVNRTLTGPSCRCRTESWWRRARISASLSRLLIGSSRSSANTFVTPR